MKSNTKKKIMDTATLLFASQGFKGTTMQELTQTADLSRAAFGYYFANRQSLYQAILEEHFIPARATLQAIECAADQTAGAGSRIMLYAKAVATIMRQQPFFLPLWQSEIIHPSAHGESTVMPYTSQLYQSILSALYGGISSGEFTAAIEPYQTASLLVEMLHSHFLAPLARIPSDKDTCMEHIRFLLLGMKMN